MSALKIAVIAAERAGFVRAAPLLAELRQRSDCEGQFIFAGEEYVPHANSDLFRDVGLPYADVIIGASEGTAGQRLAKVMAGCERLCGSRELGAVVLVGSSNVILGCSVACARADFPVAHADAGLRAPGIAGRTSLAAQIDRLSSALMAASEQAHDQLLDEGAPEESVVLTGSLACDAVARCIERARAEGVVAGAGLEAKGYVFVVVETPENIEHLANLRKLVSLLAMVQDRVPVALSVHQRLVNRLESWQCAETIADLPRLSSVEPSGYAAYLCLLDSARLVLTDVGGVQDEATFLGVPCLTLAKSTDRAATVAHGGNFVVGLNADHALQAVEAVLENDDVEPTMPSGWDGRASERIADALLAAAERKEMA
ncbi:MAG: UDP-N-acetylglucosamine 2-epimerase [Armatimonadota bacterium]|nr:MAG: UDP-N-acetylglucosamine 2-epimerase [Armatimonadota bacterium]